MKQYESMRNQIIASDAVWWLRITMKDPSLNYDDMDNSLSRKIHTFNLQLSPAIQSSLRYSLNM